MDGRTNPKMWEEVKEEARKRLGGHSARAMQLAGRLYRERGGAYFNEKTSAQKSLTKWTAQDWTTKSGLPSKITGERYLPRKAISSLTAKEYKQTSEAKRLGTMAGKQWVPQPKPIAEKTRKFRI